MLPLKPPIPSLKITVFPAPPSISFAKTSPSPRLPLTIFAAYWDAGWRIFWSTSHVILIRFCKTKIPHLPGKWGVSSYKSYYRYRRLIMTPLSDRVLRSFSCLIILSVMIILLLKSGLDWDRVCEQSAALWCCKNCLRELLCDDSTHLADGLHRVDQVLLHRHKIKTSYLVVRTNQECIQFRNLR